MWPLHDHFFTIPGHVGRPRGFLSVTWRAIQCQLLEQAIIMQPCFLYKESGKRRFMAKDFTEVKHKLVFVSLWRPDRRTQKACLRRYRQKLKCMPKLKIRTTRSDDRNCDDSDNVIVHHPVIHCSQATAFLYSLKKERSWILLVPPLKLLSSQKPSATVIQLMLFQSNQSAFKTHVSWISRNPRTGIRRGFCSCPTPCRKVCRHSVKFAFPPTWFEVET